MDVYDLSRLPSTNGWVLDDPVWRYGVRILAPISVSFRIPRDAYLALLKSAKLARIEARPTGLPSGILDGEMFRLSHAS